MKGKKEYIILFILIAALAGYLYLQRTDRVHYEVPQIDTVDTGALTWLEIISKDRTVSLTKKDGSWYIEPKGYPADTVKVGKMLQAISDLTLTDLVSESGSVERYNLGEADRITVKAYTGTELTRKLRSRQSSSYTPAHLCLAARRQPGVPRQGQLPWRFRTLSLRLEGQAGPLLPQRRDHRHPDQHSGQGNGPDPHRGRTLKQGRSKRE